MRERAREREHEREGRHDNMGMKGGTERMQRLWNVSERARTEKDKGKDVKWQTEQEKDSKGKAGKDRGKRSMETH